MRTYIRLFINLLLPLTLLFTVASVGYFTFEYSFSKAFKLGILSGVVIGISISLIMAFLLLMFRKMPKSAKVQKSVEVQKEEKTEAPVHVETKAIPIHKVDKTKRNSKQENGFSKEIKCMLLMDKELTFDVIVNAFNNENGCTLSKSDPQKGTMTIQTKNGIIQTTVTSLTQHTSQIILQTVDNTKQIKNLISHIKEKEHSFLQY